jgi:L-serine dehydratase
MESLTKLYKIGPGPSSSHTIGPKRIADAFKGEFLHAYKYKVNLYGSLALTGKGHLTDYIIEKTLFPKSVEIHFINEFIDEHPNCMDIFAYDENDNLLGKWRAYSVGGGEFKIEGKDVGYEVVETYPHNSMEEIKKYISENNLSIVDYVYNFEDSNIKDFLFNILDMMFDSINRGLNTQGKLPGKLNLDRVAKKIYDHASNLEVNEIDHSERTKLLVSSYAYAVSEENASGGEIVTAPTCGSSGVLPATLYYFYKHQNKSKEELVDALAVAGVFGNLVKKNATISGALGGCQAEIGTACSMAASAAAYLFGLNIDKIEYAAEVAMEHHLGLTCDPVKGYVQIPCIERNGVASLRAYDSALYAKHIGIFRKNRVSFDQVIKTMASTGRDLNYQYKETSLGGLAAHYQESDEEK